MTAWIPFYHYGSLEFLDASNFSSAVSLLDSYELSEAISGCCGGLHVHFMRQLQVWCFTSIVSAAEYGTNWLFRKCRCASRTMYSPGFVSPDRVGKQIAE